MRRRPTLDRAWALMLADQALPTQDVIPPGTVDFLHDAAREHDHDRPDLVLDRVEDWLATLPESELETLCCGDQEDWEPILARAGEGTAAAVNTVLTELFMATGL